MICKLTGKEGPPAKAHVIPESFYLIDPSSKTALQLMSNAEGIHPQKSWKGVYDETIVTQEGERFFAPWDDYAYP